MVRLKPAELARQLTLAACPESTAVYIYTMCVSKCIGTACFFLYFCGKWPGLDCIRPRHCVIDKCAAAAAADSSDNDDDDDDDVHIRLVWRYTRGAVAA